MEHKDDGDINCNWWVRNDPQRVGKGDRKSCKSEDEQRPSKLKHC